MRVVSHNRNMVAEVGVRLSMAAAWIGTVVTVALLLVLGLLIAMTPKGSGGWSALLAVLLIVALTIGIALSSFVGTVGAFIALRSRHAAQNRQSLVASLTINGLVLAACVSLYLLLSVISAPRPTSVAIRSSGVWFRPGDQESVALLVSWSAGDQDRELRDLSWVSTDPSVFTVVPSGMTAVVRAVAPGVATLRATSPGGGADLEIRVLDPAIAPPAGPSTVAPLIRISEFRLSGPRGDDDDFVAIRNVSDHTIDISGWTLAFSDAAGRAESIGAVPSGTQLPPECPYLFGSARPLFGDRERMNIAEAYTYADFSFWPPAPVDGGVALLDADGRIVDQVGARGSRYSEGTPLPPNPFASGGSYFRRQDGDDNAADFVMATEAARRSYESTCGRR